MNKYTLTTPAEIRHAAELAGENANNEPNQSGYNAAWLHGYAYALHEVAEQLEPTQPEPDTYAGTVWSWEDVQAVRPEWDEGQCRRWWKENERSFREMLTQYGNEILSNSAAI